MSFFKFFAAVLGALVALPAHAADADAAIWNAQFIKFDAGRDDKRSVRLELQQRADTEVNHRVLDAPCIKIDARSRLESRQWENIPDHSARARSMIQTTMPITERARGVVIFAEPFYTGNDTPNVSGRLEQVRDFGGFIMPVNENAIS